MPALDAITADYVEDVTFLGVAGRSNIELTAAAAPVRMPSGRILWGLDEDLAVWELYGVRTQPVAFLITSGGEVVDTWYGILGDDEVRSRIDRLVEVSA